MGFLSHLFKHREAGDASPVGEGCAGKTEIPPQIAGIMRLELGDVLPRVPEQFVRAGEHDLRQKLSFDAETVAASMARGRVEVPLPVISEQCPSVFFLSAHAANEVLIRLPLQKLVEQLGALPSEVSPSVSEIAPSLLETVSPLSKIAVAPLEIPAQDLETPPQALETPTSLSEIAVAPLGIAAQGLETPALLSEIDQRPSEMVVSLLEINQQLSGTPASLLEIDPCPLEMSAEVLEIAHSPFEMSPPTEITSSVAEENDAPRAEIPVERHDAPRAPLPLDGYLGEDAHFQVTVAASAGIPFLASLRPAVLGATIPAPEIPAAHAAPPEGSVAVRPLGIQPPPVKPIIFPPRPASSVAQIAPSAPATPLPVAESVVRKSGERYAALQPIFMTDETLDLAAIARHCAALPGVKACVLRVGADEEKSGEFPDAGETILHTQTIRAGDVILRVLLSPRGFIPGVRERLAQAVEAIVSCDW